MPEKSFLIYRSSAGSGKTFALAREYLSIALKDDDAFKSILGVTFTNKATGEMKRRILDVLHDLAGDQDHPMKPELLRSLQLNETSLKKRASRTLSAILHQYSRFSVVTIDSFFHQVIRSFAREIGLQGSFSITLDNDEVMQKVIDGLLAELGRPDRKQLRTWLTRFAESNLDEGKPWDFQKDVKGLAKEILEDDFKEYAIQISQLNQEPEFFENFLKELQTSRTTFEQTTRRKAREALDIVTGLGGVEVFKRKSSGPAGLFLKVESGDFDISKTRRDAIDDPESWLTKQFIGDTILQEGLRELIFPRYKALIQYMDDHVAMYHSTGEVQRYFFTFGILSVIGEMLQAYRDENDTMLISDLPDFLRQIIDESETPYIYEKVGSIYKHFLIDEFQDTSVFQWQNFKSLVKNGTDQGDRSMVVGDIKQSIYRWRGGDWKLLQEGVRDHFPKESILEKTLEENWRSGRRIVEFNNRVFGSIHHMVGNIFSDLPDQFQVVLDRSMKAYENVAQVPKRTEKDGFISLEFISSEDSSWKEKAIYRTICLTEELQRRGFQLRDIAILTRSKSEGKEISDAFFAYKNTPEADPQLSYEVISAEALYLYSSHGVKMLIGILKWLYHEEDQIALSEWLYEYHRYILGDEVVDAILFHHREKWQSQVPIIFVESRTRIKTLPVYELIEELVRIFRLNEIKEEFTYLQAFQDAVLDFKKNEGGDISQFLEWWEKIRKDRAILVADENDAIKILTIHKAKGLEFPVVIAPFLSWNLDHETYARDEIMWCAAPAQPPLNQLPVVPLKYTQSLKKTIWSGEYWTEKISAFIDNLNLLYVTFTRPIDELYVFGELPEKERMKNVGDLSLLLAKKFEEWDTDRHRLELGTKVELLRKPETSVEFGLNVYPSNTWRNKVSLQMKASEELTERIFSAQKWGVEFHQMLGKLRRIEDLPSILDEDLKRSLQMIVQNEDISPFFTDIEEVKIEASILLPDGGYNRIDRLVKKSGTWHVIDFKTGLPRQKDKDQVNNYVEVLARMGYNECKGHLIYLDPVSVEHI